MHIFVVELVVYLSFPSMCKIVPVPVFAHVLKIYWWLHWFGPCVCNTDNNRNGNSRQGGCQKKKKIINCRYRIVTFRPIRSGIVGVALSHETRSQPSYWLTNK